MALVVILVAGHSETLVYEHREEQPKDETERAIPMTIEIRDPATLGVGVPVIEPHDYGGTLLIPSFKYSPVSLDMNWADSG